MARRRSRVTGTNILRRKLRRMGPQIQREVQDVVRDGLNKIQRDAMALAPVDDGDLRESIDVKLGRDKLTGIVGPGVKAAEIVRKATGSVFGQVRKGGKKKGQKVTLSKRNRHAYWQMLKGYWNEFGTKGASARRTKRGSIRAAVPARSARPFMQPAYKSNLTWIRQAADKGVERALKRASRG